MTTTYTVSSTFTRTHASYLASKIASDLLQMQLFYGKPSDDEINAYLEEVVILLLGRYFDSVEYGFQKGSDWIVALKYRVRWDGTIVDDSRSGRVPYGVDIAGAHWYSYLRYSSAFCNLSTEEQERITQSLSIKRTSASEPRTGNGAWVSDKYYSSGGGGLQRDSYRKV